MRRIENPEWLRKHLSALAGDAERVVDSMKSTEYNHYTALKLIALRYYAAAFLKVATNERQKKWYDGAVYLDLFAGTGMVRIKDSKHGDILPGSAMCVAMLEGGFDYIVCVERNARNCDALRARLGRTLGSDRFDVISGDCNSAVSRVISVVRKRFENPIVLVFADPEGLELKFATLRAIGDAFKSCDFVVNVNEQGVIRTSKKYAKGGYNVKKSIEEYTDEDVSTVIRKIEGGESPRSMYAEKMSQALGKSVGDTVKIRENGDRIAYYLLCHTRKTGGGAGYIRAFKELTRRISWADGGNVRRTMDVIKKRQPRMEDYDESS